MKQSVVVIIIFLIFSTTVKIRANDNQSSKLNVNVDDNYYSNFVRIPKLNDKTNLVPEPVLYDHFVDSTNVVNRLNGKKKNCEQTTTFVNSASLYNTDPKDTDPKQVKSVFTIDMAELERKFNNTEFMFLTIPDKESFEKLPKSIKDMFPRGLPNNGATVMLERDISREASTPFDPTKPKNGSIESKKPQWRISSYWNNDNFVLHKMGNDSGYTTAQGIEIMQINRDRLMFGLRADSHLFTVPTGNGSQYAIDKTDIELLWKTQDAKVGMFNVNLSGSATYSYISSKDREGRSVAYPSTLQNSLHEKMNYYTYTNQFYNKGESLNVGEQAFGATVMATVAQDLQSESGRFYGKWEVGVGGHATTMDKSSYVNAKARGEVGVNFGSNSSVYMYSDYELRQYKSHLMSEHKVGVGTKLSDTLITEYEVSKINGHIGGISDSAQDNDLMAAIRLTYLFGK